jgi:hypothetical protein
MAEYIDSSKEGQEEMRDILASSIRASTEKGFTLVVNVRVASQLDTGEIGYHKTKRLIYNGFLMDAGGIENYYDIENTVDSPYVIEMLDCKDHVCMHASPELCDILQLGTDPA